jgi:hypothetical protein
VKLGPLVAPAAGENAGLAPDHDVAGVGEGGADQVDDRVGLHPAAHRFRACPRLARAPAREDEPDDPVSWRWRLIVASPERPVMERLC